MTGGLMQLVAYGAQDVYLTGDPMITHFKTVYRRHTNFAMECIEQSFNGNPAFGSTVSSIISRNGDLISGAFIETTVPDLRLSGANKYWTENVGHHLIKKVEIEIGGQIVDIHYGEWLDIWAQLTVCASKSKGYYAMIGQDSINIRFGEIQPEYDSQSKTLLIPLQFWFCRNIGMALPLVALQYHEVKINVTFADAVDLVGAAVLGNITDTKLWVDYIYLDVEERRKFIQSVHEYLIEQLQFNGGQTVIANASRSSTVTKRINIDFNHPVKEIIWVVQPITYKGQPSNYTAVSTQIPQISINPNGGVNPVVSAKLTLNGHDRFDTMPGSYFNNMQPFNHHTCIPKSPGINVYSFALNPEDHQPSGTCNFSRIDNSYLNLRIATLQSTEYIDEYPDADDGPIYASNICNVKVYAVNYNILRIMSGLGGLAYTN